MFHKRKKDAPILITGDRKGSRNIREPLSFPDASESQNVQFFEKYSLIFHAILSCAIIFVIEWISRHSLSSAVEFVGHTPLVFLYNSLLIFASLLLAYLFRHRGLVRMALTIFWLLLGVINGCILSSRVTPFNFTDLKLIGDLLSMKNSKYFTFGQEIAVIVSLVIIVIFLIVFAIKGPFYKHKIHRVRNLICLGICLAAIPFLTKGAIHADILAGYFGNLAQGYKDYGFVYSFTASMVDTGMREPKNYSENTINLIEESINTPKTTIASDDMPNIIFIQLESFIDPEEIKFLNLSDDAVPNFRYLQENYTSGYLTVPIVGAGTANTEFEILTGMGIQYFGLGEYPYKTVLKTTACESAASTLGNLGYSTHALHNNGGNFYSRATVFSNMGFDTFTSKELMNITSYNEIGTWPTDDILVDETTKTLDSSTDQSDFIYTITVQSHGSYADYKVFDNPAIKVSGAETESENNQWEYFVNEVYEVDQVIGDLIAELSERDEKTMVVMYGDHLPTMGLNDHDMKSGDLYKTTYVTWNNFGLEKQDKDVTSYQLMSYITGLLDIHEGTIFKYHQTQLAHEIMSEKNYLANLKNLQYDLLYGQKYAYANSTDLTPTAHLEMGVEDVVADKCYPSYDRTKMIVTGSNFTPWSKVYVNGEKVSTKYLSENRVQISMDNIADGDTIVVNQVGSSDTIFRSSNEIIYHAPADLTPDDTNTDDDTTTSDTTVTDTSESDVIKESSPSAEPLPDAIQKTLQEVDEDHLND